MTIFGVFISLDSGIWEILGIAAIMALSYLVGRALGIDKEDR